MILNYDSNFKCLRNMGQKTHYAYKFIVHVAENYPTCSAGVNHAVAPRREC